MNRRGVLGMLGIGAAAGPAVVSQLGSQGSLRPIPSTGGYDYEYKDQAVPCTSESPLNTLKHVRERYDRLTTDKSAWIADRMQRDLREAYRYGNYNAIDPDIMAMKSFSHGAKLRLHFQRRAEYSYTDELLDTMSSLEYWMKEAGL